MIDTSDIVKKLDIFQHYKAHIPSLAIDDAGEALGICPFHGGEEPRFEVDLKNGRFHCWDCLAGGDIVEFIMKLNNRPYEDSMIELALKAGLDPDEDGIVIPGSKSASAGGQVTVRYSPDEELFPPVDFPLDALPNKFKKVAVEFSRVLDIDVGCVAAFMLAIESGAIGKMFQVSPNNSWEEPVPLWVLLVAESGFGKSPLSNLLMGPIYRMEKAAEDAYRESLISDDPENNRRVQYIVSDATVEALADAFLENPLGIIIYVDELGGLILGMNQYKTRGNDKQRYLMLFDCKSWKINRVGRGVVYIPHTGAAILGGIQTLVVPAIFKQDSFNDGMIFRFLLTCPEMKPRKFNKKGASPEANGYWGTLLQRTYEQRNNIDTDLDNISTVLPLDSDATEIFEHLYEEFEQIKMVISDSARGFIAKSIGYSLRLAGVLHVIEKIDAGEDIDAPISAQTMENAVRLVRYFVGQAIKVLKVYYGDIPPDWATRHLIDVLSKLRSEVKNGRLYLKKIQEEFNEDQPDHLRIDHNKHLGMMIKKLDLQTAPGTGNRAYLVWEDGKIDALIAKNTLTN